MLMRTTLGALACCAALLLIAPAAPAVERPSPIDPEMPEDMALTPLEQLGKLLFFDTNLSKPSGQACAACHAPVVGFTGPDSEVNAAGAVHPGAIETRFGNRKPPAAAYGGESPILYFDAEEGVWTGGMFWDGRATGWTLGDPLAEQALGPFQNPVEQNLPSTEAVCRKVSQSSYARLFEEVWGQGSLDCVEDVAATYVKIGRSIAAYERSLEVNPFSSKYDLWLRGEARLTPQERKGLVLFRGKAMCAACHVEGPFTDFTYDNLGVPRNPQNPWYTMTDFNPDGYNWVDRGLGAFLQAAGYGPEVYEPELGKVKVPTLRNVDLRPYPELVKAYGHNGYFKSLKEIVHFYNTRDVLPTCVPATDMVEKVDCWPEPEVAVNVNRDELGDLGLSDVEEDSLVAFMAALSDGYMP